MWKFLGIDSWTIVDRKFFIIFPELISVLLLIVTIMVNKTIPYQNVTGYDEFKE